MTEQTLADTTPQAVDATWQQALSPELKAIVDAKGYKSPADVVQAYAHAQRLIGADKVPLPKDGVWDETARDKLGIPRDPGGYEIARPSLPEGIAWDEAFEAAALPVAHRLGLTPTQLQGLMEFYAGHQSETGQQAMRTRATEETTAREALKSEWGAHFDTRLAQAARAARYFGGEQLTSFLNETGLGNHPDLVRAFARAGALLGEDAFRSGSGVAGPLPPDEALKKAKSLMAKPAYAKQAHPEHSIVVDEVRQLFEQAYAERP